MPMMILLTILSIVAASIASIENEHADGSFNIGLQTNSKGSTGETIVAYLTKSAGWTEHTNPENVPSKKLANDQNIRKMNSRQANSRQHTDFSITTSVPYQEILKLIEVFVKFKGEIASRVRSLIVDNYELIQAVMKTVISKVTTLHSFTLNGIIILRKVLEFASALIGHWTFSFGLNNELPFSAMT